MYYFDNGSSQALISSSSTKMVDSFAALDYIITNVKSALVKQFYIYLNSSFMWLVIVLTQC